MCEAINWVGPYIMRLSGIVKNINMSILGIDLAGCFLLVSGFMSLGMQKLVLLHGYGPNIIIPYSPLKEGEISNG